jgi:hypothetical protein
MTPFRPVRFRLPPTFKLWPDNVPSVELRTPVEIPARDVKPWQSAFPDVQTPAFPVTPPIPPTVAPGDLITAVHENTVSTGINDLWIDLQWLGNNVLANPTTSKGDLIVNDGSALARLPVGVNAQVLTTDLTQPLGMKWTTPSASGSFVPTSRQVIAGAGMSGGGALTADVTLNALVTSVFGRTGAVVLTSADITGAGGVPATRRVIAGAGMTGGGALSADVTLNANVTSVFGRTGDVVLNTSDITASGGVPASRKVSTGTGLTGGGNLMFDLTLAVVDDTTNQRTTYAKDGVAVATRHALNVITGANITLTMADDVANNRVNLTIASTGGSGGSGSQTPWTQHIDAAGFYLNNLGYLGIGAAVNGAARVYTFLGSLPQTAGSVLGSTLAYATSVNYDELSTSIIRDTASATWDTALWRIARKVDTSAISSIDFGYLQFGVNTQGVRRVTVTSTGLGVGTTSFSVPLSLGTAIGDKLAIYDAGIGQSYGFGIQSYQFQMYGVNNPASRVSIGFGSSASFTEVLTVKANLCVGINYATPNDALVINGLAGAAQGQLRMTYGNYGVFFRNDGGSFYCMTTASGDPYGTWSSVVPWSFDLASKAMSMTALTVNGATYVNGGLDSPAHFVTSSNSVGSVFASAAIEIRETNRVSTGQVGIEYSPRIGFHWGGQVAAQIGMDASGLIRTFDNPGTSYAPFGCANLYCTAISATSTIAFTNQLYGNGKIALNTADGAYIRINESGQFANGVWFGVSFVGMSSNTLAIGSVGGSGCINISATSADAVNRVTINGNASASSFFNTGGNFGVNCAAPSSMITVLGSPGSIDYNSQQIAIGETGNNPQYRMTLAYQVLDGVWKSTIQSWAGGVGNYLLLNPRGGVVSVGAQAPQGATLSINPQTNATSVATAKIFTVGEQTNTSGYYMAMGMFHDGTNWNGSLQMFDGGNPGRLILNGLGGGVRVGSAASPGYALDVTGDVNCTGTFRVNGAPISGGGGGGPTVQNVATGAASLSTIYRNGTGKPMWVSVSLSLPAGTSGSAYTDANSNPTTVVGYESAPLGNSTYGALTFVVLPNNYYRVLGNGVPAPTITGWVEWY